jgi:hypothetical protein
MPRSIRNPKGWTIRKLVQNTHHHMPSRFDYRDRDVLKSIIIKEVHVYDGKNPGEDRTTFKIESRSYPQYYPYYTKKDKRGRERSKQRTYRHEYEVIIQVDSLSIDDDRIKLRTGADAKWDFSTRGSTKKVGKGRNQRIVEGSNIKRGLNGDHFFRLSYIRKQDGILYGRNYAGWFPKKTNPQGIQFLTKHELRVIEILMNRGFLK